MGKKVLLFAIPYCGGAERKTIQFGKILEQAGWKISACLVTTSESVHMDLIPFIPKQWPMSQISCRYRFLFFHIMRALSDSNADVVFTSNPLIAFPLLFIKRMHLTNKKIIYRECNTPDTHTKWQIRMSRFLYPMADMLISQTQEMKTEMMGLYGLPDEKIITINNPVDRELILEKMRETVILDPGHINYVACNRVEPQKDIATLLKAFAVVRSSIPDARLYIIGREGRKEYMDELYEIITEYQLSNSVIFTGFQSNPYKYMNRADVFVLSSIYEGLPNAMLEAMYLGRPVAATRCIPYISQVVHDGVNGYTCPPKDFRALAESMIKAKDIAELPQYVDVNNSDSQIVALFDNVFSA